MIRKGNGYVDDLARLDFGPAVALPRRIEGAHWSVTVERCTAAWLRVGAPTRDDPGATMAAHQGDRVTAWLAPGKWLVLGPRNAGEGAWFDLSSRYLTLRVEGDAVGFATAMTGLDPAKLVLGRSLTTRMAGLPVTILPRASDILILAERGREGYWIDWLSVAAGAADTTRR